MTAAILAVLTSAQLKPAERLTEFLRSSLDRGVVFVVSSGARKIQVELSFQSPNLQYMKFMSAGETGQFFQTGNRALFVSDLDRIYFEYRGFSRHVGPPPEAGIGAALYPSFLHGWRNKGSLDSAVKVAAPQGGKETLDWLMQTVETEGSKSDYYVGIGPSGEPHQVLITGTGAPPMFFEFKSFGWPLRDMRAWKYQPPEGYMLGNAPKLHRQYQAGNKVEWGKWVDGQGKAIDMNSLNSVGVAVVFTSADGIPDKSFASALADLKKSLEKLKVKVVEVHLDSQSAPKRDWPVTLDEDGKISAQFDPPYTPYIFFVRKDRYVIGSWAGYGADQKAKLIKTANDLYNPPKEE